MLHLSVYLSLRCRIVQHRALMWLTTLVLSFDRFHSAKTVIGTTWKKLRLWDVSAQS